MDGCKHHSDVLVDLSMPTSLFGAVKISAGHHDGQSTCYTAIALSRYADDQQMKLFIRVAHSGIGPVAPPLPDGKVVVIHGRGERAHAMGDDYDLTVNIADPACFTVIPTGFGAFFPLKYTITGHLHEVIVPSGSADPARIKLEVDKYEEARPYFVRYAESTGVERRHILTVDV